MNKNQSGFQVDEQGPKYYQDCVEVIMAPFVRTLVATAVQSGDDVLDVACGTGFATRAAAMAVGSGGTVVGSDLSLIHI